MKIKKATLKKPLTAQLEITDVCNHRCEHCYNLDSDLRNRPDRKVPDETVIKCAEQLIKSQIFSVVISGGEPLVKKDLTKTVISKFLSNNIEVHLNSNIVLIDDDFIEFLSQNRITLLTSCPSTTASTFNIITRTKNYNIFLNKIKKLLNARVKLSVNMVVSKSNLNEVYSTANDLIELGVRAFAATPMGLNVDYPRKDLLLSIEEVKHLVNILISIEKQFHIHVDIMEALPKCVFGEEILNNDYPFLKRRCQAGRNVISVACNGDVRPCAHNNDVYGNIINEPIELIWERMYDWRANKYIPDSCKNCTYIDRCLGGCRTSSYAYFGDWKAKDIWSMSPLSLPPKYPNNETSFQYDDKISFNKNIVVRKEDESTYVIYNKKDDRYLMVNKELALLIKHILTLKENSCMGVIKQLNIKDKKGIDTISEVFKFLIKNRIIIVQK